MKKLFIVFLLTLTAFGLFILLGNKIARKEKIDNLQKVSVRLKWVHQAQFAGFYVAKEKGFYRDQGLDVTLNPAGPDISPIQMVLSGIDDFGIIGSDQIMLAREKGVPIVAISVIYKKSPVALASLKGKNITSPGDLEGKTVAVVYGKDEESIYRAMLEKSGIDRNKIHEVPLTFDLSQITSDKVDSQIVYEINEPVLLEQKGYQVDLIKPRDYGVNFYSDTLFTTEENIRSKPDVVRKLVMATIAGWNEALNYPEETTNIVLKFNPVLDYEHQLKFLKLSSPLIKDDGEIGRFDEVILREMGHLLIEQGVMKKEVDLEKGFSNKFLN